jgi:hypothetical protein
MRQGSVIKDIPFTSVGVKKIVSYLKGKEDLLKRIARNSKHQEERTICLIELEIVEKLLIYIATNIKINERRGNQ